MVTEGFGVPRRDPLPDPLKIPPPLPTPPSICMVDPEMLPPEQARLKGGGSRTRKPLTRPSSGTTPPKATPVTAAKTKGLASGDRASRPLSARSEPSDKGNRASLSRKPSVPKTTTRGPSGKYPWAGILQWVSYIQCGLSHTHHPLWPLFIL